MRGLFVLLCILYVISPIDFIPDFIPVVGWGDDVIAGVVGLMTALSRK